MEPVETGIAQDRYPTIPWRLGDTVLDGDLDTGSHGTFVDALLSAAAAEPTLWFAGQHLGRPFEWSPGRTDMAVALPDGSVATASLPIRWVRAWAGSPFVRINPARRALVGRDALRALNLEVSLRAGPAETHILGATQRR